MDESTRSFLLSLAAVVFLAALGATLARPVFQSAEPRRAVERARRAEPARPETPTPAPTASPMGTAPAGLRLGARLPRNCLRRVPAPSAPGLIAVASRRRVTIAPPAGGGSSFPGRAPVMWSPSGRYLAFGGANLYDTQTEARSSTFGRTPRSWTWSPVADCMFGRVGDAILAAPPGVDGVPIVTGPVSQFSVTADGRYLIAYSPDGDALGVDLRRHAVVPQRRSGPIFEGLAPFGCDDTPEDYVLASCAASRRFGVAIYDPDHLEGNWGRLWLVDESGDPVRAIASGSYEDTRPEWGPPGTGVLFLRRPSGGGPLELWYLPEGGSPQPAGPTIAGLGSFTNHESFSPWSLVDWNVTPPDGGEVVDY